MKYILTITDTGKGLEIRGDTLATPEEFKAGVKSPAEELGKFLQRASEVWVETINMDKQQLQLYAQALVTPAPKHH